MIASHLKDTFAALQHPNYRLWFMGQLVSLIGTWMQSTAQGFLIFDLTHSAAFLGYVSFAAGIPTWLLTLYGGVIADRIPKRTLLIITQSTMMVLASILAVLTFTHTVQPWHIIALAFMLGIANAFDMPGRQAFVAELVERKDLTNAIALNATMFNLGVVTGPAVAGLVYAWLGPAWCFTINAISFIAVIAALLLMRVKVQLRTDHMSPIIELKEGVKAAFSSDSMKLLFVSLFICSAFGFGILVLAPAWAVDVLHGNVTTNGLLLSARGVGSLISGLVLATVASRGYRGKIWTLGSILLPISVLLFGMARWLPFSLLMIAFMGLSLIMVVNIANGLIQANTSDEMRGRVMSIYALILAGGQTLGSLFMGLIADRINEPVAAFIGAGILGVLAIAIYLFKPFMRKIA
jgi:MFS family permease